MSDPDLHSLGQGAFLSLQIGGARDRLERLLLIGRPHDGVVRVREWTTQSYNTEGEDYEIPAAELLQRIEELHSAHLTMNEGIHSIRRWLAS